MSCIMRIPSEIRGAIFTYLRPENNPIVPSITSLPPISRASRELHHDYVRWFYSTTTFQADSITNEYEFCPIEGWHAPGRTHLTKFIDNLSPTAVASIRKFSIKANPSELIWLLAPEEAVRLLNIPLEHFPYWQQLRQKFRALRLNLLHLEYLPTHCCPRPIYTEQLTPRECRGEYLGMRSSHAIDDRWIWKSARDSIQPSSRVTISNNFEKGDVVHSQQEMELMASKEYSWNLLTNSTTIWLRHSTFHLAKDPFSSKRRKHYWYMPGRLRSLDILGKRDGRGSNETEHCYEQMQRMFELE